MKTINKILIIQAGRNLYKAHSKNFLCTNITCPVIAAAVPEDINIEIIDMYVQDIDYDNTVADLAFVTSLTTYAPVAFEVCQRLRENGIYCVLGGVHATVMPDECQEYADSLAIGEAELLMDEILNDFRNDSLKKRYHTNKQLDLTTCRIPRYDLLQLEKYLFFSVMASKGCAFDCDFCSSRLVTGAGFRHKTTDQIVSEIKYLQNLHEKNPLYPASFFFIDSNLYTDRKFLIELLNALIPLKLKHWGMFASVNIASDDEILNLLSKANCEVIQIGFESINSSSLKSMNKGQNNPQKYKEVVSKLARYGIYAYGSFIFGFDNDNKDIFAETLNAIEEGDFIVSNFSVLTPFPGTKLYERLLKGNRILHKNWTKYNMEEVVYRLDGMSEKELISGFRYVREKSADPERIIKCLQKFNQTSGKNPSLKTNEKIALIIALIYMFFRLKPQTRFFIWSIIRKGNLADYYLVNNIISAIQNP